MKLTGYISRTLGIFALAAAAGMSVGSCSDNVSEDALYTLTANTAASYVDETDGFTIFRTLMDDTDTRGLLSTYGHYTCFIPTDDAFRKFFDQYGFSLETMSEADKKELIYNHIIMSQSTDYSSNLFEEGPLPVVSMSSKRINISFRGNTSGSSFDIVVNSNASILERDIEVHNGILHILDNVVYYPDEFIDDILRQHPEFSLFNEALTATGVNGLVRKNFDENYEPAIGPAGFKDPGDPGWDPYFVPQEKALAYTCFAETNDVFAAKGITTIEDMAAYAEDYYGTADRGNYTSSENALNKFMRYHILDRRLGANEFFDTRQTVPSRVEEAEEFYPTLLDNRLIEFKNRRGGVLNFRNYPTDVSRVPAYVSMNSTKRNISAVNAYIHGLDDILVYDENIMREDVLHRRIRTDIMNIMPEIVNNNYRWIRPGDNFPRPSFAGVMMPGDGVFSKYFKCSDLTRPYLAYFYGSYHTCQFYVRGWFDYEISTLPIPPGEWEMRIGCSFLPWYGIAQLYIDGKIQGIPIDLSAGYLENDLRIGWEPDVNGVRNIENDKAMRNRGYMKGPKSEFWQNSQTLRDNEHNLRVIVGRFNADDYGTHTFRSKNIYSDGAYFVIEYIELIPTALIENEDEF